MTCGPRRLLLYVANADPRLIVQQVFWSAKIAAGSCHGMKSRRERAGCVLLGITTCGTNLMFKVYGLLFLGFPGRKSTRALSSTLSVARYACGYCASPVVMRGAL